jgi:hypothetical protein
MTEADTTALLEFCTSAREMTEAGVRYIYLAGLRFCSSGITLTRDALLCPVPHSGYVTRLFLSEPVPARGSNWNQFHILGKSWHTPSFKDVSNSQPLVEILAAHLRGYA